MLLLTRNVADDKTIIIRTSDGDVIVSIQDIQKGQVRVGIDAPRNVVILRSEIVERQRLKR